MSIESDYGTERMDIGRDTASYFVVYNLTILVVRVLTMSHPSTCYSFTDVAAKYRIRQIVLCHIVHSGFKLENFVQYRSFRYDM